MNNYLIEGWEMPTFQVAAEKLQMVVGRLAEEAGRFCMEAHFADFGAMKKIAQHIKSERFACYCWTPVEDGQTLLRHELRSINHAHLLFGSRVVKVAPEHALPPYNWDGLPAESVNLTFGEKFWEPVDKAHKEGNPAIAQRVARIVAKKLGTSEDHPVKIMTSMESKCREHSYIVTVPRFRVAEIASEICREFDLHGGVGSFEILGSVAALEKVVQENTYSLTDFPADCRTFNKTPFALERSSFLHPVLNISGSELGASAAVIDQLADKVTRCSIIRKYFSWRLAEGVCSPKTQGNYALLSPQKAGYSMFVGFEQYADGDPSAKQFTAAAFSALSELGVKLKKVAFVR